MFQAACNQVLCPWPESVGQQRDAASCPLHRMPCRIYGRAVGPCRRVASRNIPVWFWHWHGLWGYFRRETRHSPVIVMESLVCFQVGRRSAIQETASRAQIYLGSDIKSRCQLRRRLVPSTDGYCGSVFGRLNFACSSAFPSTHFKPHG